MGEKGSWEGIGDKVEQKNKIKQETGLIQTISELCMTNAFLNFMSKKKNTVVSTIWIDSLETSQIIMPASTMARAKWSTQSN